MDSLLKRPLSTRALLCSSAGMVFAMMFVALVLGTYLAPLLAYVLTLFVYWCFCWIHVLLFSDRSRHSRQTDSVHTFWYLIPYVPLCGVLFVAFSAGFELPDLVSATAIVTAALVNGFTEEFFWRKVFADRFGDQVLGGLVAPTLLYSSWHFALLLIPNVNYEGGGLALVGGALILGSVWGICYWRTRNLVVVVSAHSILNVIAIVMLARDNSWSAL